MKAILLGDNGQISLSTDLPKPTPKKGEALIKTMRAGVCNTDLEIAKGYANFKGILGHEFVGEVKEINDPCDQVNAQGIKIEVGDRVVGEINITCGNCSICDKGGIIKRNHCSNRTVLGIVNKDGCFAEYICLPIVNLYKVPENLTNQEAAFAEPLAAAFRIIEQQNLQPTDNIAVIGDGKLGLMICEVLSLQKINQLSIFGKHKEKMSLCPENVKKVIVCKEDVTRVAGDHQDVFDICVDACGTPAGLAMSGVMTKPMGTIILKTTCADDKTPLNTSVFVVKEQLLVGSRCGNFEMALNAMKKGEIKVAKYLEKSFSLDRGLEALKAAAVKGTLKVQIVMNEIE